MFNVLSGKIGTCVARVATTLAANKGELLVAGGLAVNGLAFYEFHKAGMKIDRILDEGNKKIERIEAGKVDPAYVDQYSEEDAANDLKIAKRETAIELAKNYIWPVVFGVTGTLMVLKGVHVIEIKLADTSAALALALKANENMYNRIKDKYGEDAANAIKYGYDEQTSELVTMNEDGTTTVETIVENVIADDGMGSPYAVFIPENHPAYERSMDYMNNIVGMMDWNANNKCRQNLSIPWFYMINEMNIMDLLNDWQKAACMAVGWTYDPEFRSEDDPTKDNFIHTTCIEAVRPTTNEPGVRVQMQKGYILDFNVEGNIQKKLEEKAVRNVKRREARKAKKLKTIR